MLKDIEDSVQKVAHADNEIASNVLAIFIVAAVVRTVMDGPHKSTLAIVSSMLLNLLYCCFAGYLVVFYMHGQSFEDGVTGAIGGGVAFIAKELLRGLVSLAGNFSDSPVRFLRDVAKIVRGKDGKGN